MKTQNRKFNYREIGRIVIVVLIFIVSFIVGHISEIRAQSADHLTDEEVELIRSYQEVDNRMKVYVKAIERRFLAITGSNALTAAELKRLKDDKKKWGALPKGSRTKLLTNMEKILNEAIDKIDDVAARDPKSGVFANAVHILADGAKAFIPRFRSLSREGSNTRERALISTAVDYCNDIIEASAKIKKPAKRKKKKRF